MMTQDERWRDRMTTSSSVGVEWADIVGVSSSTDRRTWWEVPVRKHVDRDMQEWYSREEYVSLTLLRAKKKKLIENLCVRTCLLEIYFAWRTCQKLSSTGEDNNKSVSTNLLFSLCLRRSTHIVCRTADLRVHQDLEMSSSRDVYLSHLILNRFFICPRAISEGGTIVTSYILRWLRMGRTSRTLSTWVNSTTLIHFANRFMARRSSM